MAETALLELPSASPGSRSPPSPWRGRGRWSGFYLTLRAHRDRSKLFGYGSVQPIDREWRLGSSRSRGRFDEARGAASVRARRCGGPRRPGGCGRDTSVPGRSVRQRCLAASRPAWSGPGPGGRAPLERLPACVILRSEARFDPPPPGKVVGGPAGWSAPAARPPGPARRGRHPDPDRGRSMGVR